MFLDAEVVVQVDSLAAEKDGPELPGLWCAVPGQVTPHTWALPPGHLLHWPHPGDASFYVNMVSLLGASLGKTRNVLYLEIHNRMELSELRSFPKNCRSITVCIAF